MTQFTIRPARPDECARVALFLKHHELAIDDIDPTLPGFFVADEGGDLVGTVGVELLGKLGLLRSLAVSRTSQGQGLGKQLYEQALKYAKAHGIEKLYLLTTTAETFFAHNGFVRIERQTVPEEIKQTEQYSRICPDSAIIMEKML